MSDPARKILLVDDEEGILGVLSNLLKLSGYEPITASDGPGALRKAAAQRPDVVVLDVWMPGMTGDDVLRKLKADPVTSRIPVIMLSAIDDAKSMERCFNFGAQNYLVKPVKTEALLEALDRALASESSARAQSTRPPAPAGAVSADEPRGELHELAELKQELELLMFGVGPAVEHFTLRIAQSAARFPDSAEIKRLKAAVADIDRLLESMNEFSQTK